MTFYEKSVADSYEKGAKALREQGEFYCDNGDVASLLEHKLGAKVQNAYDQGWSFRVTL